MTLKCWMRLTASTLTLILSLTHSPAASDELTGEARQQTIEAVIKLLTENYVYPETASRMAAHLKKEAAAGAYQGITDPGKFAEQLTADLQSVSRDKHLRVSHSPEMAARLLASGGDGPPPEDRERFLEESRRDNFAFRKVEILDGNIGYLRLDGFSGFSEAGETATAAMNFLANTDALIIDLRQNGGGNPSMIQIISSYLFDGEPRHLNSFYWRPKDETTQTWTLPYVPGKRNPDAEVFVLTSARTFSAAEEFTYNLKNMERATIVGETTGGGAHPGGSMAANDQFVVWVPKGRAINPITNTNWEGTGVEPDIAVPAEQALDRACLEALTRLLEKAEDERLRARYRWAHEGLEAKLNPVEVPEKLLRSYAGEYGPRTLTFKDGRLYYQRGDGPVYPMVPMADDLFRFEEVPYFRLKILREGENAVGVKGLYDNGRTDEHGRTDN